MPESLIAAAALHALPLGVAVVCQAGKVVMMNAAFRRMLEGGALRCDGATQTLGATAPAEHARLCGLIAGALAGGESGLLRIAGQAEGDLWVRVAPMQDPAGSALGLVTARSRKTRRPPRAATLRQRFGLTPAEAEIASGLGAGRSPEAIAAARGRSVLTVRTQVRHVLAKTGSTTLHALVALVASMAE